MRARPEWSAPLVGASFVVGAAGTLVLLIGRPLGLALVASALVGLAAGIPFAYVFSTAAATRPDAPAAAIGLVNMVAASDPDRQPAARPRLLVADRGPDRVRGDRAALARGNHGRRRRRDPDRPRLPRLETRRRRAGAPPGASSRVRLPPRSMLMKYARSAICSWLTFGLRFRDTIAGLRAGAFFSVAFFSAFFLVANAIPFRGSFLRGSLRRRPSRSSLSTRVRARAGSPLVGAVDPPDGSTVIAIVAPFGTLRVSTSERPRKRPAGRGARPGSITHASYVFPAGAAGRRNATSAAGRPSRRPRSRSQTRDGHPLEGRLSGHSRAGRAARRSRSRAPIATQAATAATAASTRAPSAAAAARRSAARRAPPRGSGRGAPAAAPRLGRRRRARPRRRESVGELLPAASHAGEMLLVRLALVGVERVERVGGGQLVDRLGVHVSPSIALEQLAQPREPREHPALDRAERLAEPLGQLRLREPAVVGELDRLALLVGQLPAAPPARARARAAARRCRPPTGPPASASPSGSGSVRRRSSRRTRSTARRWTSVMIQVLAFARSGMNRAAPRQTARNASCTASSASASSRSTRSASPYAARP